MLAVIGMLLLLVWVLGMLGGCTPAAII